MKCHFNNMKRCTAVKKNKPQLNNTTWMDFTDILWRKESKDTNCMIAFIWGSKRGKCNLQRWKAEEWLHLGRGCWPAKDWSWEGLWFAGIVTIHGAVRWNLSTWLNVNYASMNKKLHIKKIKEQRHGFWSLPLWLFVYLPFLRSIVLCSGFQQREHLFIPLH